MSFSNSDFSFVQCTYSIYQTGLKKIETQKEKGEHLQAGKSGGGELNSIVKNIYTCKLNENVMIPRSSNGHRNPPQI